MDRREIEIYTDTITLGQFLKWAGVVQTGQEAKHLIQEGEVILNGVPETRRGKKLQPGDTVGIDGLELIVVQGEQEV
ncbi:MAG: S4 domain-containing protein YaaA [Bacillota bacterium]|jgi:ribosome-associated protein